MLNLCQIKWPLMPSLQQFNEVFTSPPLPPRRYRGQNQGRLTNEGRARGIYNKCGANFFYGKFSQRHTLKLCMTPCFQPLRIKVNNCFKTFVTHQNKSVSIFYPFEMKRSDMLFSSALYFTGHSFSNVHLSFFTFDFFYTTLFISGLHLVPQHVCVLPV